MVTMHFIQASDVWAAKAHIHTLPLSAQMLQFPLSDLSSFPWNNVPSMHSVANVLDLVSMNHLAARISPSLSVVAFYMCLIWIVAIVVAAVW